MPTRLTQTGAEVQDDLYKIEDIDLATEEKAGLMSPEDKTKLDNIDAEIPTKLSDLEEDPTHRTVTDAEKTTWNNKSDFDGKYDSLIGRPYIPQRTSDLRNDSGFITNVVNDLVNYYLKNEIYTKAEVDQIVSTLGGFTVRVVDVLPTASEETMRALYLVPSADPEAGNVKDEWITIENTGTYSWERIGSTEINLDGYVTDDELTAALQGYVTSTAFATALAGKQDVIQDLDAIRAGATAGASAYQKPVGGIPASDLASGVIPDVSGFYEKPSGGIPSSDMAEAVRTSLGKADTALQSFTETDPTVPSWAKAQNPPTEIFVATYGTTTAAEVEAAITANKEVVVKNTTSGVYYGLVKVESGRYVFSSPDYFGYVYMYILNRTTDMWSSSTTILQGKNLVTSFQSTPDDTHYPSEKLVKDSLDAKQDAISDLETIRSGAAAGATAYQKPATGIPASDIAAGVIPDVSNFITKSVNDLVNYYTKSETYTQTEVNNLIGAIQQFHYEIVATLPASGAANILYLLGPTGSGADKYEEYVYANNAWVKIGDTSIDLSGYYQKPAGGIPASDLASAVQTSLGLADTAVQPEAGKGLFSGNYNDLSNKPTIPTVEALTTSEIDTIWNTAMA